MKKEKTSKKTRFVAARRNSDGTLSEFKDNNGKTYDYEQALEAVEQGMIDQKADDDKDDMRHAYSSPFSTMTLTTENV